MMRNKVKQKGPRVAWLWGGAVEKTGKVHRVKRRLGDRVGMRGVAGYEEIHADAVNSLEGESTEAERPRVRALSNVSDRREMLECT